MMVKLAVAAPPDMHMVVPRLNVAEVAESYQHIVAVGRELQGDIPSVIQAAVYHRLTPCRHIMSPSSRRALKRQSRNERNRWSESQALIVPQKTLLSTSFADTLPLSK
ncbi:hypothetical protein AS181_22035 [Gordonia sp. SGD-V-85]|nr:hypothetical protein AS181_22035 [Gordonia sp. SGD-V-85]